MPCWILCLSVLHPRERVAYDHHARVVREDHACAFRWLAKLYDEGHDLTPASCFYLGRAYLRGECGVLVNRERAECFLADVVAGSHNHDMCPSYAEMGLSTGDCIATGDVHNGLVAHAADELIRLWSRTLTSS